MDEDGPDLKGLREFANRGDRQLSPIFVGREEETGRIARKVVDMGRRHANGEDTAGGTTVITGCPGSGKSAFLRHVKQTVEKDQFIGTTVVPIQCSHLNLRGETTEEVETELAKVAIQRGDELGKTLQAVAGDAGGVLKLRGTFRRLQEVIDRDKMKRTVLCLLVDEVQNVTAKSAAAIELLHTEAFAPPVLPVYAGLDDSVEKLKTVGRISRLSEDGYMTMGRLPPNAAGEAVRKLFEKYGVRSSARTEAKWAEAVHEESQGFARHLQTALQAAARVLAAEKGQASSWAVEEVRRQARNDREQFYGRKIDGALKTHQHAVIEVMDRGVGRNRAVMETELGLWAREAMDRHDWMGRTHSNEEAMQLVKEMRHAGVLQLSADNRVEVPIPSLHTWLTKKHATAIGWERPRRSRTAKNRGAAGERE